MDTLAKHLPWSQSSMYTVLDDANTPRPPEQRRVYVYHSSFDDPSQEAAILAPMPGAESYEAQRRQAKAPKDVPPELAPLYTPLLSKEQEQHLFREMNFLKHKAARLLDLVPLSSRRFDAGKAWSQDLAVIEELRRQAQAIKARLVNCNLRLVVSIAKRYAARAGDFSELLSAGNVSLITAVERFDFSRGNKFSTYASWVIMKDYASSSVKEERRRRRYRTGCQAWVFETAVDTRSDEKGCLAWAEQTSACAHRLLQLFEFLNHRERQIIHLRLGLDDDAKRMTLEDVGKQLGVTKERVRQLQAGAMKKLRNLAAANSVELP